MSTRRRTVLLAAPLAAGSLLAACAGPSEEAGTGAADIEDPEGTETLTTGLNAPWALTFHGETALISERDSARILELLADGSAREVAVLEDVVNGGEGGLLGLAVHEEHLVTYATTAEGNRIERRPLTGEPGALSLGEAEVLLEGIPAAATHNGGRLAVGPDGMLYATTGDATDRESAQDLDSLAGKILRIAPDGSVPEDNPFPDSPVYSYGHRNPQGIAWTEDGSLVASEFGQDIWDELNLIEAGGNYGWPSAEGIEGRSGMIDPIRQWRPGEASPSGIAVLGAEVYVACLRGERLRVVPWEEPDAESELLVGEAGRLRDVVLAPDGTLWILTNTTDGRSQPAPEGDRILRLLPSE